LRLSEGLGEEEQLYKSLYARCPEVWEEPVEDWAGLVRRCHKAGINDIPNEAPSMMGSVLTEDDFFTENFKEVVCFNNLRYCPPFLHKLEFIKIIYVWSGSVTVYLDNVKYELLSGNFCIITPGIRHTVFSRHDEDVIINILMRISSFANAFSGILMEQNILADFFWKILYTKHSNRVLMFGCNNDPKLDRWVERMFDESARQQAASNLLMKSYAMIFLGIVMREHLPQLQLKEELTDEVYVLPAIIQAIRQNLKSITLEELTRQFGMSESELKRYIVRESGYTYRYLLRDLRLRRAVELLRNTNLSMERIMEETGYSNMNNFYRSFKEHFGQTPLEFRKNGEEILI
jgi:AraC family transcriptional activator of mtrCDE